MKHIVLIGDSIFDNRHYVNGGPDVSTQLQQCAPADWKVTLLAVDGSTTTEIPEQLEYLPADATHLVMSIGGNDALLQSRILGEPTTTISTALVKLSAMTAEFAQDYQKALAAIVAKKLPAAVCTIYYPRFANPIEQEVSVAAMTFFNDTILRLAIAQVVPVLDLRLICNEPGDYANAIEPSVAGGAKISRTITRVVQEHDFGGRKTVMWI